MRLNVYLQKAGIGSRREAERLVADNRVQVNGIAALATTPVEEGDQVTLDGRPVAPSSKPLPRLFRLHKPLDVLVTTRDHKGRRTVFDLPALHNPSLPRLMSVGRLDVNSEGLLMLTSDGPLAQAMMKPETGLARVYRVRLRGKLTPENINALAQGIEIGGIAYRGAEFVEEYEKGGRSNSWYRVVLTEGKNREIRKLAEHFGCVVNRLIRVQYGPFQMGTLAAGALAEIPVREVEQFLEFLGARGVAL